MLFNTFVFWLFFFSFYAIYHFVAKTRQQKLWLIVCGSLLFYAAWDARFVPLLFATALFDFYIARAIDRSRGDPARKQHRRRLLLLSIVANLGVLAIFKYCGFFVESFFDLLHMVGVQRAPPMLRLVLPIGISFYTFQSMSYTIDVYRRQLAARERPIEFLAAVTFFPHLVAGPIIRASTLLAQFETFTPLSRADISRGFLLIGVGLFNKTLADLLAPAVGAVFESRVPLDALSAWTGALAFAGQIYGDFAGYSSIAIGVALLLGFKIPPNFNLPYLATSMTEHWQRWHISLSSWLRDYLFLPLALRFPRRPQMAIVLTMVLAGLWHGAAWTFVVFGLYHGLLLALTEIVAEHYPEFIDRIPETVLKGFQMLLTFYLVVIAFVLFRSNSFARAKSILTAMHWPQKRFQFTSYGATMMALVVLGLIAGHAMSTLELSGVSDRLVKRPLVLGGVMIACITFTMMMGRPSTFIYFQF